MQMFRLLSFLVLALPLTPVTAQAEQYPDHPVRVVVGYAAGSGPDIQARTVAQQLGSISVSSSTSRTASARTERSPRVRSRNPSPMAIRSCSPRTESLHALHLQEPRLRHVHRPDADRNHRHTRRHVHAGPLEVAYKTLEEFIDHAKKERALYGSPGVGNGLHLAAEIFAKKAGIKMQHIPYKGASEVMTGMLGGSVEVMFVTPPSVIGLIKDGRVRPLAFTGTKPFPAPRGAADEGPPARLRAAGIVGHVLRARQDTGRNRREAQRGGPQGDCRFRRFQHHAARRLHSRQSQCRRNRRLLPQGSPGGARR